MRACSACRRGKRGKTRFLCSAGALASYDPERVKYDTGLASYDPETQRTIGELDEVVLGDLVRLPTGGGGHR
jgi:hypothetical protein